MAKLLPDSQQVAVRIDDGEFPHAPRLVLGGVHPRDPLPRELRRGERLVETMHIRDAKVASGRRLLGQQRVVGEEVDLQCAAVRMAY